MVHKTNKAHFRNLLPNRFLDEFVLLFLYKDLSDNLTETTIVKNSNDCCGFCELIDVIDQACNGKHRGMNTKSQKVWKKIDNILFLSWHNVMLSRLYRQRGRDVQK